MRNPSAASIRARLTLLVLACIVPLSLVAAAWIALDYRDGKEELARQSIGRARAIGSTVDLELAGIQGAMAALATSPHLAARNYAAFHGQAAQVAQALGVTNVVLVDAQLQQVVNTVRPLGSALPRDDNPLVQTIFRTGRPFTSDVFVGPASGRPLIAAGIPVMAHGEVAYVLGVGIWLDRLGEILRRQRLEPGWIGVILDSSGTVVARTHQMEKFAGTKAAPALLSSMKEAAEGHFEARTLEGIPVLSAFSRSAISRWTVAIGIPSRELEAQLWQSLAWLAAAVVLAGAVTLVLAWRIGESIARPVRALVRMAERIGEGEPLGAPRPLALREADEVAGALRLAVAKTRNAEHRARHDALTGLANRALFAEFVAHEVRACARDRARLALLFIDLDGFKQVNDRQGHDTGDEVLRQVAARLRACVRESDVAARLGGDEFGVLVRGADAAAAATVAAKILDALSTGYTAGAQALSISASIGIALYPDAATSAEALLKRADEAMYRVKGAGKRAYAFA